MKSMLGGAIWWRCPNANAVSLSHWTEEAFLVKSREGVWYEDILLLYCSKKSQNIVFFMSLYTWWWWCSWVCRNRRNRRNRRNPTYHLANKGWCLTACLVAPRTRRSAALKAISRLSIHGVTVGLPSGEVLVRVLGAWCAISPLVLPFDLYVVQTNPYVGDRVGLEAQKDVETIIHGLLGDLDEGRWGTGGAGGKPCTGALSFLPCQRLFEKLQAEIARDGPVWWTVLGRYESNGSQKQQTVCY